jgi:predicted nucleic acid-binding protein
MVTTYADSSVLVASYANEPHSPRARRALMSVPQVPYTPLHHLEVCNALRVLVGRRRLTLEESSKMLVHLEDDVAAGRLLQVPVDLYAVLSAADALSARHAARILSRSLDTLHVAAALELGCSRFVTFDTRQARLAAACGLKVADLIRTRRRARRR